MQVEVASETICSPIFLGSHLRPAISGSWRLSLPPNLDGHGHGGQRCVAANKAKQGSYSEVREWQCRLPFGGRGKRRRVVDEDDDGCPRRKTHGETTTSFAQAQQHPLYNCLSVTLRGPGRLMQEGCSLVAPHRICGQPLVVT